MIFVLSRVKCLIFLLELENPCNNDAPILKESPSKEFDRDNRRLSLKSSFDVIFQSIQKTYINEIYNQSLIFIFI